MLQNKFEMPLDLEISPSKLIRYYLITLLFFSFLSVSISTSLPGIFRFILFVILVFTAAAMFGKRKEKRITALRINADDKWTIEINNKSRLEVELQGECIVTSFLVWLNFSAGKNKKVFHILLLADSVDKDLLRQLRVRLRFLKDKNSDEAATSTSF